MKRRFRKVSLTVLVIFLIAGCASMENRWEETRSESTIAAYGRFLKEYPEGKLSDQARKRMNDLVDTVFLDIKGSFPEGYDFFSDESYLLDKLKPIFQHANITVVTNKERADAVLKMEIESNAIGSFYSLKLNLVQPGGKEISLSGQTSYHYSGARVSGKISLIIDGQIVDQEDYLYVEPCPYSIEKNYPKSSDAPFRKALAKSISSETFSIVAQFFNMPHLLKWKFKTGGTVDSSPAVVDGTVYVGSDDDYVYALDAADGSLKWKFETGGSVNSSPAVANGIVYIGSDDDYVYALEAAPSQ